MYISSPSGPTLDPIRCMRPLRCMLLQTRFPDGDAVLRQKHLPVHPRSEERYNGCPLSVSLKKG